MAVATYVHLGEKQVIHCEKTEAAKHPVISRWLNGAWAKASWVTENVLAISPTSVSTKKMLIQTTDIIAASHIDQP